MNELKKGDTTTMNGVPYKVASVSGEGILLERIPAEPPTVRVAVYQDDKGLWWSDVIDGEIEVHGITFTIIPATGAVVGPQPKWIEQLRVYAKNAQDGFCRDDKEWRRWGNLLSIIPAEQASEFCGCMPCETCRCFPCKCDDTADAIKRLNDEMSRQDCSSQVMVDGNDLALVIAAAEQVAHGYLPPAVVEGEDAKLGDHYDPENPPVENGEPSPQWLIDAVEKEQDWPYDPDLAAITLPSDEQLQEWGVEVVGFRAPEKGEAFITKHAVSQETNQLFLGKECANGKRLIVEQVEQPTLDNPECAKCAALENALQALLDEQNGPSLIRDATSWYAAVKRANELLTPPAKED